MPLVCKSSPPGLSPTSSILEWIFYPKSQHTIGCWWFPHRRFLKPKAAGFGWRHANLNLFLKETRFSFSFATKAAPSVVSERVDCWLPHRLPTNIAHQYRLPTPISRSGSVFVCQDSLWHLREVIRSGRPCSPWKSGDMRSTTPYVSSNHPMSKFTAHNQPLESVTSTEQDHSKEKKIQE